MFEQIPLFPLDSERASEAYVDEVVCGNGFPLTGHEKRVKLDGSVSVSGLDEDEDPYALVYPKDPYSD